MGEISPSFGPHLVTDIVVAARLMAESKDRWGVDIPEFIGAALSVVAAVKRYDELAAAAVAALTQEPPPCPHMQPTERPCRDLHPPLAGKPEGWNPVA